MNEQVVTFGCRLNIYESEIIKKNISSADLDNVIVINTCAVTNEAERQAKQKIRQLKRKNPSKEIIVTGCAVQITPDVYSNMPEVTAVLGNAEKLEKKSFLEIKKNNTYQVGDIFKEKEGGKAFISNYTDKARAFLEIQNGCNHRCTFCTIPYGRGNSRSVPMGALAENIRMFLNKDYKEIIFTGVDITDYGSDLPGTPSLGKMIKRVLMSVPKLTRLRLSSIDVAEIDDDLMYLLENEERLMPHIHLSLQSGDDLILKRMKRRHNRQQVLDFCHQLKSKRKDVSFGADIITGFPTEEDEHFLNSVDLVMKAGIQYLHVFPYSEKQNTPAAKMPQIPVSVRKDRAKILRDTGLREKVKFMRSNIGKVKPVLVEKDGLGKSDNFISTRILSEYRDMEVINTKMESISSDYKMIGKVV